MVVIEEINNKEKVNHPSHYSKGGIEAIDVIEAWDLGFCLGNTVKYISRAGSKPEQGMTIKEKKLEDLKKAKWYLDREISNLDKQINSTKYAKIDAMPLDYKTH